MTNTTSLDKKGTTFTFKIHRDDRKAITAAARRIVGKSRVRVEVNERFGTRRDNGVDETGVANLLLLEKDHDLDQAIPLSDYKGTVEADADGAAELDICVCTMNYSEWEPTDWLTARFEKGRLVAIDGHPVA